MDKNNIVISTISWARDEKEEKLLRESLQILADHKVPVFVCDGGSGAHFLDFLQGIPHFTIVPPLAKGVFAQAKSALIPAYHSGAEFIFYTEPDKKNFFTLELDNFLSSIEVNEQSGVVLASRSKEAFDTFPSFQKDTETAINNCCAEIIGKVFEFTYGPFLLNRKLVPYLEDLQNDIGWGWRPFAFHLAQKLGLMVESFEGYFPCPVDQRIDSPEERVYRIKQLKQNLDGLLLSLATDITEVKNREKLR